MNVSGKALQNEGLETDLVSLLAFFLCITLFLWECIQGSKCHLMGVTPAQLQLHSAAGATSGRVTFPFT